MPAWQKQTSRRSGLWALPLIYPLCTFVACLQAGVGTVVRIAAHDCVLPIILSAASQASVTMVRGCPGRQGKTQLV